MLTVRRALAALVLAVVSLVGVQASPAAAHHTHSPYTLCSAYRPSGYSLVQYHSHYYSSGHPAAAHCYYRNNATFGTLVICRWYESHATTSGSICAH